MTEAYQVTVDLDEDSSFQSDWEKLLPPLTAAPNYFPAAHKSISKSDDHIVTGLPSLKGGWALQKFDVASTRVSPAVGARRRGAYYLLGGLDSGFEISLKELDICALRVLNKVAAKQVTVRPRREASAKGTPKEFAPSNDLVDVVVRGSKRFASHIEVHDRPEILKGFLDARSKDAVSKLVSRTLMDLIATISFRQSDGLYVSGPVSANGEFSLAYLNAFQDVFPVWPTDIAEFQSLLNRDMIAFLSSGGKIQGGWGKLFVSDGNILASLNVNNVTTIEGDWTPARSVRR